MPSPLAHTLMGLSIANLSQYKNIHHSIAWLIFIIVSCNAADLDFLAGFMVGDINRFHHGVSHSIGFALIYALICCSFAKLTPYGVKKIFIISFLLYVSHLVLDYLGTDKVAPYGAQFLWPFSDGYFISPISIFSSVEHGHLNEQSRQVIDKVFSTHNFYTALSEFAMMAPIWVISYFIAFRRR